MNSFLIQTKYRTEFINITDKVALTVRDSDLNDGVITVFIPHTTAGVTINENADPDVMLDMKLVLDKLIPWKGGYSHSEGNTAAHVKATLTGSSINVILKDKKLQLGCWQGIYFCEFDGPRNRKVWVSPHS